MTQIEVLVHWLLDNGGAMVLDPVNLIGFGIGGQAAKQGYTDLH